MKEENGKGSVIVQKDKLRPEELTQSEYYPFDKLTEAGEWFFVPDHDGKTRDKLRGRVVYRNQVGQAHLVLRKTAMVKERTFWRLPCNDEKGIPGYVVLRTV